MTGRAWFVPVLPDGIVYSVVCTACHRGWTVSDLVGALCARCKETPIVRGQYMKAVL